MSRTKRFSTSRKTKVVGKEQYVNASTGEIKEMNVIQVEDRDFNFHKVWLSHIISSLDLIGNQKIRLAFWIMDHLDRENKLCMNYRQIVRASGISMSTVQKTMTALLSCGFLQRINQGSYRVNPNVMFKGSHHSRMNVMIEYSQAAQGEADAVDAVSSSKTAAAPVDVPIPEIPAALDNPAVPSQA